MPGSCRPWAWRVFLTCWLVYSAFWTPYIVREHFPALTLAESGTLNVERYLGWSDDIFRGPQGGAFINNNPGASLTGAIPLLLFRPLLDRVNQWNQTLPRPAHKSGSEEFFWRSLENGQAYYFLLVAFLTVALVMAPATAATAAYLCSRLTQAGVPAPHAAAAALLYGLATPVFFRAGHLNHNLLVCDAGFTALLLLWDPQGRPVSDGRVLLAGLLAGYTLLCDFSGLAAIAAIAFYVWLRRRDTSRWRSLAAYAVGVFPGVAALAIYQAWAFGSLFRPSQHYMAPTAPTSHGYRGFDWPSPALAWANFFDPRFGLFAYCPALILAFAAPFLPRLRYRVPRREICVIFTYFGLFVVFCAANQYSWLQPLTGFRYLAPVVPGLALLAMQTAQALPKSARIVVAVGACTQSLVLAAAHENDIRASVGALWERRFKLPWMIRLGDAGVPITWAWPLILFLLLAAAVAWIWIGAGRPSGVAARLESES